MEVFRFDDLTAIQCKDYSCLTRDTGDSQKVDAVQLYYQPALQPVKYSAGVTLFLFFTSRPSHRTCRPGSYDDDIMSIN